MEPAALADTNIPSRQVAINGSGTLAAVIACVSLSDPSAGCQDALYIKRVSSGEVSRVTNECMLPWRPLTGLGWISDSTVQVDQWASPSFGNRFVIDVISGLLVALDPLGGDRTSSKR
jgi:hypothetical protein